MPPAVVDLHCDLLSYLVHREGAHPDAVEGIGCALPHLDAGGVALQVFAIFTPTKPGSPELALAQARRYRELLPDIENWRIEALAALENASGLCAEGEPLKRAFERLEAIEAQTGPLLYASLTQFGENRFGGGNGSSTGLKDDGAALLELLAERTIALDLAHASDALAWECLEWLERHGLDLPIIASHSNFRAICDHERNLSDELALEIVRREGLIGINLMRLYIDPADPATLARHIEHGLALGAGDTLCFGADFFDPRAVSEGAPHYHPVHDSAARYPAILASLAPTLAPGQLDALAHGNARRFIARRTAARTAGE